MTWSILLFLCSSSLSLPSGEFQYDPDLVPDGVWDLEEDFNLRCEDDSDCPPPAVIKENRTISQFLCEQRRILKKQAENGTEEVNVNILPLPDYPEYDGEEYDDEEFYSYYDESYGDTKVCGVRSKDLCCTQQGEKDPDCLNLTGPEPVCGDDAIQHGGALKFTSPVAGIRSRPDPSGQCGSRQCRRNRRVRGGRRNFCCDLINFHGRWACPKSC